MKFAGGASRGPFLALAAFVILVIAATAQAWAVTPDSASNGDETRLIVHSLTVAKGDTLSKLLLDAGTEARDAEAAIARLAKRFDPRKLRAGQRIVVVLEDGSGRAKRLAALSLELGPESYLVVERRGGRRFVTEVRATPLVPQPGATAMAASLQRTIELRKGDTLTRLLVRAGGALDDADNAARALGRHINLRKLQVGQEVAIAWGPGRDSDRPLLAAVSLRLGAASWLIAERRAQGGYGARHAAAPLLEVEPAAAAAAEPEAPAEPVAAPLAEAEPVAAEPAATEPDENRQVYRIAKGDTLTDALVWAGAERKAAYAAAAAIARHFNPRKLRIGQELTIVFDPGGAGRGPGLAAVSLQLKKGRFVVASRGAGGAFDARLAGAALIPSFPASDDSATAAVGDAPGLLLTGQAEYKALRVRKGDTLSTALLRIGSAWRDADAAIAALSRHFDPRRLQVGQQLSAVFDRTTSATRPQLTAVSLALGENSHVIARREDDGSFIAWPAAEALSAVFDQALATTALIVPPEIVLAPLPAGTERMSFDVRAGDTLMNALLRVGSDPRDAEAAIAALKVVFDPRKLRAGQTLTVALSPSADNGRSVLERFSIGVGPGRTIETGRADDRSFATRAVDIPLERLLVHAGGVIDSSLYKAADVAGIPVPVMMEMIRGFSFDVDFQREIQRGDGFEVLFERFLDESGKPVREGNVLYAALTLSGALLHIYRYTAPDGLTDYYSEKGHSVRKALLRTPIDGARLTSGYGKRKHPTLGYTKMHRGVDFGAASGTPIMAAGAGVVEFAGWNGAYGRYIRIRHRGQYATAYAHLSRLANGVQNGRRVMQGQIIGYVGSTGRSTGPHLHYEVLLNGKQMNPLAVKLPTGAKLKGAALAAFEQARLEIERQRAELPLVSRVADAMAPAETALAAESDMTNGACNDEPAAADDIALGDGSAVPAC